jgi:hypothetical protein
MTQENKVIEVCSSCLTASCWYGEFLCEESKNSYTELKTVADLRKLKLENEENWSDKKMTLIYGEPARFGYKGQRQVGDI